jgi:hypothetical protein
MNHLFQAILLFLFTRPHRQPHCQTLQAPTSASGASPFPSTPSAPSLTMPNSRWLKVEQLPPGKAIAVLERGRTYPTSCDMDLADDTTLACLRAIPYSPPRRLIFPHWRHHRRLHRGSKVRTQPYRRPRRTRHRCLTGCRSLQPGSRTYNSRLLAPRRWHRRWGVASLRRLCHIPPHSAPPDLPRPLKH